MNKKETRHRSKREIEQFTTGLLFILPSLIMTAVFVVYPAFNVVYYSFTDWNGVAAVKNFVGLENYRRLATIDGFGTIRFCGNDFAILLARNASTATLGAALYNYGTAAKACFA